MNENNIKIHVKYQKQIVFHHLICSLNQSKKSKTKPFFQFASLIQSNTTSSSSSNQILPSPKVQTTTVSPSSPSSDSSQKTTLRKSVGLSSKQATQGNSKRFVPTIPTLPKHPIIQSSASVDVASGDRKKDGNTREETHMMVVIPPLPALPLPVVGGGGGGGIEGKGEAGKGKVVKNLNIPSLPPSSSLKFVKVGNETSNNNNNNTKTSADVNCSSFVETSVEPKNIGCAKAKALTVPSLPPLPKSVEVKTHK
jgi:hypothetical protein